MLAMGPLWCVLDRTWRGAGPVVLDHRGAINNGGGCALLNICTPFNRTLHQMLMYITIM